MSGGDAHFYDDSNGCGACPLCLITNVLLSCCARDILCLYRTGYYDTPSTSLPPPKVSAGLTVVYGRGSCRLRFLNSLCATDQLVCFRAVLSVVVTIYSVRISVTVISATRMLCRGYPLYDLLDDGENILDYLLVQQAVVGE